MLQKFKKAVLPTPVHDQDSEPVKIGLVLTGGGSHGAFEAGVIEAILKYLTAIGHIGVITGTSAGAVNAVAVGSGLNAGGSDEAIARLQKTWRTIKSSGGLFGRHLGYLSDLFLAPHQKWPNLPKPFFNPVRIFNQFMPSVVAQFISTIMKSVVPDWKKEVQNGSTKIFVNTALEKQDGSGDLEHIVLSGKDLTPDGVGASANLKELGVHFIRDTDNPALCGRRAYDGAYKENGPLNPLYDQKITDCIMIVLHDRRHNALDKEGDLKHADIHMNALQMAAHDSYLPIRLHAIEIESLGGEIGGLSHINDSSKMNAHPDFIDMLYKAGLKAGQKWLEENGQYIGQMSSYRFYQPALDEFASACPA